MLYYHCLMVNFKRSTIILMISLLIALFSAAVTYAKIPAPGSSTAASFLLQTTPSPPVEEDRSEVGSTDGIVVMGGVIVLIVLVPILLQRKAWMQAE
jgi:hypothetical protein